MIGQLLNFGYCLLLLAVSPLLIWKRFRHGKYRAGWKEKFWGRVPDLGEPRHHRVWLHAVSVGEVLQLRQVVARLKQVQPELEIVVSTTTDTGHAVARDKLPDCRVIYFPLDFTWSVRHALDRVRPSLVVLVELELWPNFILETRRRGIPLALINGRLSERSYRGYRWIRPLVRRLLRCFDRIAAQNSEYGERFVALGSLQDRVLVTGSIKFDGAPAERATPETSELRRFFGIADGETVFVAGSTQAPEERYALNALLSVQVKYPELRLILVPRHPERGDEVAGLITGAGLPLRRRTTDKLNSSPAQAGSVGLLDTVGELGSCWGLADLAFVGGSFTNRGGQNMIEPAALGAAVCFGPNVWNFKQVVEMLLAAQGARQVRSESELMAFVREMLERADERRAMGNRAQRFVLSQQGATARTIDLVLSLLPVPGNSRSDAPAHPGQGDRF